jgi:hypothetical protein
MCPLCSGGRIRRVPGLNELAKACCSYLDQHAIGSRCAGDIREIADGGPGRSLMRGLLKRVIEFCEWLSEFNGGDAATLHEALSARGTRVRWNRVRCAPALGPTGLGRHCRGSQLCQGFTGSGAACAFPSQAVICVDGSSARCWRRINGIRSTTSAVCTMNSSAEAATT